MGYDIVNVAQKLDITIDKGALSFKADTDIFPSASLDLNGKRMMNYYQPSFVRTHSFEIVKDYTEESMKYSTHPFPSTTKKASRPFPQFYIRGEN